MKGEYVQIQFPLSRDPALSSLTNDTSKLNMERVINENKLLHEINQALVEKMAIMSDMEYKTNKRMIEMLDAIDKPNPSFAVKMIRLHQRDAYMYACKTLESKTVLLDEALLTSDPDVVLTVVHYLEFTLNATHFNALVLSNPIASKIYNDNHVL